MCISLTRKGLRPFTLLKIPRPFEGRKTDLFYTNIRLHRRKEQHSYIHLLQKLKLQRDVRSQVYVKRIVLCMLPNMK